MLKKFAAFISAAVIVVTGLVAIAAPASATPASNSATLSALEVHGDAVPGSNNSQNNKFYSVAMPQFQPDQTFYDLVSGGTTVKIYLKTTDPNATVAIAGGLSGSETTVSATSDAQYTAFKRAKINLDYADNQIVTITVTSGTDTQTYTLSISETKLSQPKVISNSLTLASTAGGTQGVLYAKNYTPCTYVYWVYDNVDADGNPIKEYTRVPASYVSTDAQGVSKVNLQAPTLVKNHYRDTATVADLFLSNSTYGSAETTGYQSSSCTSYGGYSYGYGDNGYADTTIPQVIHFFNPSVTSTTLPATISQHTAFTISGAGMVANNSNLYAYFVNAATGNTLGANLSVINNNKMLATVSGYAFDDEWKTNQTLKLVVEQGGVCSQMHVYEQGNGWSWYDNEDDCLDSTILYTSANVKFTPEIATAVAISPAKGPVSGGNKVTITAHGLINPDLNLVNDACTFPTPASCPSRRNVATITIGGNPVTDLRVQTTDFYTSSDNTNWDGVAKATFIVPAGTPGAADITIDMGYGATVLSQKYIYGAKPTVTSITPSTVATDGGSMITVVGTNFGVSGTPVVVIDGVKSPYVVRSNATKLVAMVPAHTATGAVKVDVISSSGGGGLETLATLTYAAQSSNPTVTSISPATDGVSGGKSITITGTGFSKTATGVTFGGNPAKVTAATATSLTVDVPTGDAAGAVDVVVGTPTGIATKTHGFTYVADNGVTSVTPSVIASTTADADAKVTIVGVGFGAAGKIKVGTGAAANYTTTAGGTTIADVAIPTTAAGTIAISITPTGATKALTTSIKVTGPKIDYVGPQNLAADTNAYYGDANPWLNQGTVFRPHQLTAVARQSSFAVQASALPEL